MRVKGEGDRRGDAGGGRHSEGRDRPRLFTSCLSDNDFYNPRAGHHGGWNCNKITMPENKEEKKKKKSKHKKIMARWEENT